MKRFFLCSVAVILTGIVIAQKPVKESDGYVIHGAIDGKYKGTWVYLLKDNPEDGQRLRIDSCKVENNRYTFKGPKPDQVVIHYIMSDDSTSSSPYTMFFLEPGTIHIRTDAVYFANAKISGTINNTILDFEKFLCSRLIDSMKYEFALQQAILGEQGEEAELEGLRRRSEYMSKRNMDTFKDLIRRYSAQAYAPYTLYKLHNQLPLSELKSYRNALDPAFNKNPYTLLLDEFIHMSEFKPGSDIPDFKLPDPNGKMIRIKDLRGKYVLIDFWASWCGPCMKEMPNLVKLYKEYKGKNFEILGISLDTNKAAWLAAVKKMGMKWLQGCDFKSWHSDLAKKCGIKAVPYTLLIDPTGKVVAMKLRGEELEQKVKELVGKK